jgi:glycine cleavage system transcriptional repressor
MAKRFIMTAFAQDRIGVVADITKIIFDSGCNLEDTEMTQLENEFAMILLFHGEKEREGLEEELAKECRRLEKEKGITAFVRKLEAEKPNPFESNDIHSIHVEGLDQAGIVYKISNFLASHSCNISHLHSHKRHSPESGTTLYTVKIEIGVPKEMPLDDLEQGLLNLGHEMHIEMTFDKHQ